MTEIDPNNKHESFSLMKKWILDKLQTDASTEGRNDPIHDRKHKEDSSVPTIVISRGSNKDINIEPAGQTPNRPKPLLKSLLTNFDRSNYGGSPLLPYIQQRSADKSPDFNYVNWKSTHHSTKRQSISVPSSPSRNTLGVSLKLRAESPLVTSYCPASPVFRFSKNEKHPCHNEEFEVDVSCAGSDLDSPTTCGLCGHKKYYGSEELVGFEQKLNPPFLKPVSNVMINRSASCRTPQKGLVKCGSNDNLQSKIASREGRRIKRTGLKKTEPDSLTLTRSISINLASLRPLRNNLVNSKKRKSLNEIYLQSTKERRHSSLLTLLCASKENMDDDDRKDSISRSGKRDDGKNVVEYSPEVTRSATLFTTKSNHGLHSLHDLCSTDYSTVTIPSEYGQIKVMFQFYSERNALHVTLLKGSDVAHRKDGTLGVYAKICLMPGKLQMKVSEDRHNTHDPVFYELFCFRVTLDNLLDKNLRIKMYNKPGIFSMKQPIGICSIPLYNFDLTASTVIWKNLKRCKGQKDELDEFDFEALEKDKYHRPKLCNFLFCGRSGRR